jgi:hypothetical protein
MVDVLILVIGISVGIPLGLWLRPRLDALDALAERDSGAV